MKDAWSQHVCLENETLNIGSALLLPINNMFPYKIFEIIDKYQMLPGHVDRDQWTMLYSSKWTRITKTEIKIKET